MSNVLGVTLARGGSKGVPRKNLRVLAGKPLIQYSISEALKSKMLTDYVVSTDDSEIQDFALSLGAQAPFLRPAELASDTASSADALIHAVKFMEDVVGQKYEIVVEIMSTNPFKTHRDIDGCISKLQRTGANAVVAVHQIFDSHPRRIKKIENDRLVDFCVSEIPESRRQDLKPEAFLRSGSIYAVRKEFLLNSKARYDNENTRPYILDANRVINIDEEKDFLLAETLIQSGILH